MIKFGLCQLLIFALLIGCNQEGTAPVEKILVVTGGHEFEPSFYKIFDRFEDVQYDTLAQPGFNNKLVNGTLGQYDALVFYDMWQDINDGEKSAYLELLDKGQGMVFLHHSLVAYQQWDEFQKIIGGKYIETEFYDDPNMQGSFWKEDITLEIKVADKDHPVTKGVADFSIYDEGYKSLKINSDIYPLLSTNHPDCDQTIAWAKTYSNSKIVYILLGHGHEAHENQNYRKLVHNAINWVAKK
jgi:hypothetical protein